jgi:hypothetical protein
MSIFRYVNVGCDGCGAPASEPCATAQEARRMVPTGWERALLESGVRGDLCPACVARRAAEGDGRG